MPVNADKPERWKADVNRSVNFYNDWFMSFAPKAYREQRKKQARVVEREMERTDYLRDISPALLNEHPQGADDAAGSHCPAGCARPAGGLGARGSLLRRQCAFRK